MRDFHTGFLFHLRNGKDTGLCKNVIPLSSFQRKKKIYYKWLSWLTLPSIIHTFSFLSFLPSIRPSMHPSIHPSICPSIHVPTHLLIHSFINKPLFNSNWGHWETGQLEVLFSLGEYSNMPKVRRTPNEMTSEGELPNWSYSLQRVTRLAQIGMTIH